MENKNIKILFEDEALLVIHKPSHIPVHKDGRSNEKTIVDWVRETHPSMVGVGETMRLQSGEVIDRPGVVHRLDRDTTGVLVLAKTQEAFFFLKEQFQERKTKKEYRAFVWGEMRTPTGTIDKPIGRSHKDFRLWTAGNGAKGKVREAITRWTVLGEKEGFSYLSLEPKTGRTHQIRVHMKAVGHPVVGDERYAPEKGNALGFTRQALHAFAISFTHPNGTQFCIESPLPKDFLRAKKLLFGEEEGCISE